MTSTPHASCDGQCMCVYSVHVHVWTVCEHTGPPRICFWYFSICTSFDMGVTVDTALLRRRLGVLLWADIRASMSSSGSSSENSCGWQHSHLIRREWAYGKLAQASLCVAQFFLTAALCGWMQPASVNSIRQVGTECGNLFTHISHTKSQCHWVYNKLESMNGWVGLQRNRVSVFSWGALNTNERSVTQRQSSPYTDHQILHLFSAYSRLDACCALWSELWSEINIQPHVQHITFSSSAHRSWAYHGWTV